MSDVVIEQRITAGDNFTGDNGGSVGTITSVAGSALLDGESFFLKDGWNAEVEFVFNLDTAVSKEPLVTNTLRRVPFAAADTANDIRDAIVTTINTTPALNILASDGGAATVALKNRLPGVEGNVSPTTDTVVNAGFVVSNMAGGLPGVPSTITGGIRVYEPANRGGLVDFDWMLPKTVAGLAIPSRALTWIVERLVLQVSGATSYDVSIVLPDGTSWSISSGGGALVVLSDIKLVGDERLMVTTTGGTLAMFLRATGRMGMHVPA